MLIPRQFEFCVQMLAACLLLTAPFPKRHHYLLRLILGAAAILFLSSFITLPENSGIHMMLTWVLIEVMFIPLIALLVKAGPAEVLMSYICSMVLQHMAHDLSNVMELLTDNYTFVRWLVFAVVYFLVFLIYRRHQTDASQYAAERGDMFIIVTAIVMVQILSVVMWDMRTQVTMSFQIVYNLSEATCCAYILKSQLDKEEKRQLRNEVSTVRMLLSRQKQQYEISQENIDIINRKCHDMKHQLHLLQREMQNGSTLAQDTSRQQAYFQEIENAMSIYDTKLRTGNDALDVILMEKSLRCQANSIDFTCMADGRLISFMDEADIYALFGNAIDNAIHAVMQIQDKDRRVITLRVAKRQELTLIQVINYYEGELQFRNGLPQTSQQDRTIHGYGMASMQYTVNKYNGNMNITADKGLFNLQILLPLQRKK